VATILPFIRARADFDDETTRLMGEAFDAARASLDGQSEPEPFYEIVAARIVEAARKGERDPIRLRDIGLAALGYKKDAI
jgi:UDP-2,3-diacylglucosamine pyrophosphatase LpxH